MTSRNISSPAVKSRWRKDRRTPLLIVALVLILAMVWWTAYAGALASSRAAFAEQSAHTLAEQVLTACSDKQVLSDTNLCKRADTVMTTVPTPAPGANGDTGADGKDGIDGKDGAQGIKGDTGVASVVPGPPGPFTQGQDSVVPGPAGLSVKGDTGAPSLVPGPPGTAGVKGDTGAPGRSVLSIVCVDTAVTVPPTVPASSWVFTFSDATTQTVSGPCRVAP